MKKYKVGDEIEGTVTGITDYGIFLSFDNNSSGLIHISEISHFFVKDVHEYAKLNDKMKAVIISIEDKNHYKLSIKENEKIPEKIANKESSKKEFESLSNKLDFWIKETTKKIKTEKKKQQ